MKENQIVIGTPVIYWAVIKENGQRFDPLKTVIISEPIKLGHGEMTCKVKCVSGVVSIKHLDPISPGSLMAAKLSGLKEITDEDFKNATEKYFNDRGVDVKVTIG